MSARSRWARPSPPTRCWSARATACCCSITKGFRDALRIAYQARPDIFAKEIILPEQLYERVIEVDERVRADGTVEKLLDIASVKPLIEQAKRDGIEAVAIVFMHAWKYPEHEQAVARLCRKIGFAQLSVSHEVSPLVKLVGRGDTTVVDAYLSPILSRYVGQVAEELGIVMHPPRPEISPARGGQPIASALRPKAASPTGRRPASRLPPHAEAPSPQAKRALGRERQA